MELRIALIDNFHQHRKECLSRLFTTEEPASQALRHRFEFFDTQTFRELVAYVLHNGDVRYGSSDVPEDLGLDAQRVRDFRHDPRVYPARDKVVQASDIASADASHGERRDSVLISLRGQLRAAAVGRYDGDVEAFMEFGPEDDILATDTQAEAVRQNHGLDQSYTCRIDLVKLDEQRQELPPFATRAPASFLLRLEVKL